MRGASGPDFPVERWRVKTASPLVGSAVLRLAQQLRPLAMLAAMRRASSRVSRCAPQMRLLRLGQFRLDHAPSLLQGFHLPFAALRRAREYREEAAQTFLTRS